MSEARVAALDEVAPGQPMLVERDGVRVVLSRAGDQVYACGDVCTHQGGPLSEGKLTRHAAHLSLARLDVRRPDGPVRLSRARRRRASYPVRVDGNDVFVDVP